MSRIRPSVVIASTMIVLVLLVAFAVPLWPGYNPLHQDLLHPLARPFRHGHPLGTDTLGRDLLSRLSLATRTSLFIVVPALAINMTVGVTLGVIAGYLGRAADTVIMGLADLQLSMPLLVLLVTVVAVVGPSGLTLAVVIGLCYWVGYARIARVIAASLREREFVLSSRTQGGGRFWIARKHILPQIVPQLAIMGSFDLGVLAIIEASLSYLGLGIQPPTPSLGGMIAEGQQYLQQDSWLSILPGAMVFLLVGGAQILSQRFTGENAPAAARAVGV